MSHIPIFFFPQHVSCPHLLIIHIFLLHFAVYFRLIKLHTLIKRGGTVDAATVAILRNDWQRQTVAVASSVYLLIGSVKLEMVEILARCRHHIRKTAQEFTHFPLLFGGLDSVAIIYDFSLSYWLLLPDFLNEQIRRCTY